MNGNKGSTNGGLWGVLGLTSSSFPRKRESSRTSLSTEKLGPRLRGDDDQGKDG